MVTVPRSRRRIESPELDDEALTSGAFQSAASTPPISQSSGVDFESTDAGSNASTPERPHTPADPVEVAYRELLASPLYVAAPGLLDRVEWRKHKDCHILVKVQDEEEKDKPEEEAEVEWIGEVDSTSARFNLYVCGNWQGRYDTEPFTSAKARGHIIAPTNPRWQRYSIDWDTIINGVKAIQESKRTPDAKISVKNRIVDGMHTSLKIRHEIFEPLPKDKSFNDDRPKPFAMADWNCRWEKARIALRTIIQERNYKGNVLPVFTADDELVPPDEYESRLRGALVRVKARIIQYHFSTDKTDNFFADIRAIQIISAPPPLPVSPSKRRMDDAMARYTEKRRKVN